MKNILIAAARPGASLELVNQTARTFSQSAVLASLDDFTEVGGDRINIAAPGALHAKQAVDAPERGKGISCQKAPRRPAGETQRDSDAAYGREVSIYECCNISSLQNRMIDSALKHSKESPLAL